MWRRRSLFLPGAFIGLLLLFFFFLSAPFFRHQPVVETDCLPPPPTPPPTPTREPTPIPTLSNRDRLGSFLTNLGLVGNGVEVGVKRGVFSEKVMKEWKGEHYYIVDIWKEQENYVDVANVNQAVQESFMAEALSRVSPWKDRVTVVRNYSVLASKLFPEEFFDFVYLDARHNYEGIKEDLHAWYPKLKQGGLFSGHDFLNANIKEGIFEVKRAVFEFADAHGLWDQVRETKESAWTSWYFFKPHRPPPPHTHSPPSAPCDSQSRACDRRCMLSK